MKKIAAIIVTYNRSNLLKRCIEGVVSNDKFITMKGGLFIVDNGNDEYTDEMLASHFPEARHIKVGDNSGPAGGFAIGVQAAFEQGYEGYWLFGDDTQVGSELLDEILNRIDSLEFNRLGIIKPVTFNHGKEQVGEWKGGPVSRRVSNPYLERCDIFSFGGCLIPRHVVEQVGWPDPSYFMMMEEFDYCLRVKDAGFENYAFVTSSFKAMAVGAGDQASAWRSYYQTRNHLLMIKKRKVKGEVVPFVIRQLKFLYIAIFISKNKKLVRLKYRCMGVLDGLRGKSGRVVEPMTSR